MAKNRSKVGDGVMNKKIKARSQPQSGLVGYRRPPKKYQFRKGQSGNPSGKRKRGSRAPDLKAQLERALNTAVTIQSGKKQKTYTKGAAGIEQLVDQFAKGDRNARRDLILLCEKLEVDLTNREALQSALEDALSAEDEALRADFVGRHGGQYPPGADTIRSLPAKGANLLSPPNKAAKLLAARRSDNSTASQIVQPKERSHE